MIFKWKRIVLAVAVILILLIVQSRFNEVSAPFKGIIGNILNPIVYLSSSFISAISSKWNHYINLIDVSEENEKLKTKLNELTYENSQLKNKIDGCSSLDALLKFSKSYNFSTIPANVIGISSGFFNNIIVGKGTLDGVERDDPVIGFSGIVGKVTKAYLTTSEVELILSPAMNVSVINSRTRASGVLKGDGNGGLYVEYYDRLDKIEKGDEIITSGIGRLFPKGIVIGKVVDFAELKSGLFQKVVVKEVEDFYKLENVFIIKNFK